MKGNAVKEWQLIVNKDKRLSGLFTGIEAVGLPAAYNEIIASASNISNNSTDESFNRCKLLNDKVALKLYDTYGLDVDLIEDLANAVGMKFYWCSCLK